MNPIDCFIYCTGDISIRKLTIKLATLIGANKIGESFMEKDFYHLSIDENSDFDNTRQEDFPDGFLYFKFIVEVGFNNDIEIGQVVPIVSQVLEWLWANGMPAVASCDYEDLLPNNGGHKSSITPWPKRKK